MANKVTLSPQGYTEIKLTGLQTGESVMKVVEESFSYDEVLSMRGKTVKTLIDLTEVVDVDEAGLKNALGGFRSISFDRIAIFGANKNVSEKLHMILPVSGNEVKINLFTSREEALKWLL